MLEKIIVLIILYATFIIFDWNRVKKLNRKERWLYGSIMMMALYPGLIFITGKDWPNLNDLISFFLSEPAKSIMKSFAP